MKIDFTPRMVASLVAIVVGMGTIIGWSDEISGHITVAPRVTSLELHKNCQACITLCMEKGGGDRRECFKDCVSVGLCHPEETP